MTINENHESEGSPLIFEQGKDPGEGFLRVVGDLTKIEKIENDPTRSLSFREIYDVVFAKGRSTLISENVVKKEFDGKEIDERQFKIVGLSSLGTPILVVIAPRDSGFAKRIVTAWKVSRKSKEFKKLMHDCPHLSTDIKTEENITKGQEFTQKELQAELANLLEKIGIIIDEDLRDVEPNLNDKEIISYLFFIRAAEIFKAISILLSTDADQVIPAKILLRSLSEYYILLKSSIEDESFNSRHIKHAGKEKEKWLDKTLKHHVVSGFKQDPEFFEEMKEKTRKFHEEYESNLQSAYQLFEDRKELSMYLNIYAPASMYVHGNRHSFNIYYMPEGGVRPTRQRDYSPLLRHTGLAAGQIMLQSYEVFCKVLKYETSAIKRIEELLEIAAGLILKSMPRDEA